MLPEYNTDMVDQWMVVAHSAFLHCISTKITSSATDKVMDGMDERGKNTVDR